MYDNEAGAGPDDPSGDTDRTQQEATDSLTLPSTYGTYVDWFSAYAASNDPHKGANYSFVYYATPIGLAMSGTVISTDSWYTPIGASDGFGYDMFGPFVGIHADQVSTFRPSDALSLGSGDAYSAIDNAVAQAGLGVPSELVDADGVAAVKVLGLGFMMASQNFGYSINYKHIDEPRYPIWFIYDNGIGSEESVSYSSFNSSYGDGAGGAYDETRDDQDRVLANSLKFDGGYDVGDKERSGLRYRFGWDETWASSLLGEEVDVGSATEIGTIVSGMISGNIDVLVEALVTSFPKHSATFARSRPARYLPEDINMVFGEEDSSAATSTETTSAPMPGSSCTGGSGMY